MYKGSFTSCRFALSSSHHAFFVPFSPVSRLKPTHLIHNTTHPHLTVSQRKLDRMRVTQSTIISLLAAIYSLTVAAPTPHTVLEVSPSMPCFF
ncbi:hypothetical protein Pst134EB_012256 [Puccinia striiformis f. sp. tritici]|nr:hypothetical protein Pst134EB_012256 [Puccinia striiformis f. sp. tritici]